MSTPAGRHFLRIPGPTGVPDRILRAIERPVTDHRGPGSGRLGKRVLPGLREGFGPGLRRGGRRGAGERA